MHPRGLELMKDNPYVLKIQFGIPVWELILENLVPIALTNQAIGKKGLPREGSVQFNNRTSFWTVLDSDSSYHSGFYFFFDDAPTAAFFKLRYFNA